MDTHANQKIRVLWIEDNSRVELPQLTTPVYMDRKYYLVVSENATDAVRNLNTQVFDVVVFDLRLGPGPDEQFRILFEDLGRQKKAQRLGLFLLLSFFGQKDVHRNLDVARPKWLTIERVAVLSVDPYEEPEIQEALVSIELPFESYRQKKASMKRTTLLELVKFVFERNNR